jgi:condensin complex subunit 1
MVIAALEDKASSVRRYAIALLTKLILTHPYGLMHGGLLKLQDWQSRYNAVCADLEKIETSQIEKATKEGDTEAEGTGDEGSQAEGSDEEDEDEDDEDESKTEVPATPATVRARRFKRSRFGFVGWHDKEY